MAITGQELFTTLKNDNHDLPFWKRAKALGYQGQEDIEPELFATVGMAERPLTGRDLKDRLRLIRPLELPLGMEAALCGYAGDYESFHRRAASFEQEEDTKYENIQLRLKVTRAPFVEFYSVGDPDEDDYEEDVEVRGRASGTIDFDIPLKEISQFLEYISEQSSLDCLQQWAIENISAEWTDQISMLDQSISSSQLPRDEDEWPHELDRAEIHLIESIESIEILVPSKDLSDLESCIKLEAESDSLELKTLSTSIRLSTKNLSI